MIDLKELERRLDRTLTKETKDSLNSWLNSQRIDDPEMIELQKLMDDIAEWSDKQFGKEQRNPAIVYHLKKEVRELIYALKKYNKKLNIDTRLKVVDEYADCFMLLLDSAKHFGLTSKNIMGNARHKLEINKKRKWGKPDKNGVVEHIKE